MNDVERDQIRAAGAPLPEGDAPIIARQEIEIILARQLAGYLALPIVIIDPSRTVLYYNESGEQMLGRRFDEAGRIPWTDWSRAFHSTDESGAALPVDDLPIIVAVRERRLNHRSYWLRGLDGVQRHLDSTGIPLIGNAGRFLGALGLFAELPS